MKTLIMTAVVAVASIGFGATNEISQANSPFANMCADYTAHGEVIHLKSDGGWVILTFKDGYRMRYWIRKDGCGQKDCACQKCSGKECRCKQGKINNQNKE